MLLPPGRRRTAYDHKIAAAFLAGTIAGALVSALTAWVLGGFFTILPAAFRWGLLAMAALVIWMAKEGSLRGRVKLPENKRLIPAEIFGGSLVRGALQFGFELGTGVRTYVPSPAPYIAALLLFLGWLTLGQSIAIAVGFGLARALPLAAQLTPAGRDGVTAVFLTSGSRFGPTLASVLVVLGGLGLVH